VSREHAQELHRLSGKPATNADNNPAAASGARQLCAKDDKAARVRDALFRPHTCISCAAAVTVPSALLRVLLLRRLRLPLPLAPRRCSCRGQLDALGDHRTACATSGVLATRALPLEHAVARVCREAGARVARNVRLADMNLDVLVADARRIEVVANGLPLWHGSQLAIDATIVSPLTWLGDAHPPADVDPSCALAAAAGIRHTPKLVAGSAMTPFSSCPSSRGNVPPPSPGSSDSARSPPASRDGLASTQSHAACWGGLAQAACRCFQVWHFFFFPHLFATASKGGPGPCAICRLRRRDAYARAGRRLGSGASCQRASARSSCRAGGGPTAQGSVCTGSSRNVAASARCAATAMRPVQRSTQAA